MFGIDLDTGNEVPITLIDFYGNYFIPKIFIEEIHEIEKGKRKNGRKEEGKMSRVVHHEFLGLGLLIYLHQSDLGHGQ